MGRSWAACGRSAAQPGRAALRSAGVQPAGQARRPPGQQGNHAGALFDLKVGDVIPVDVGRADVLLDEARLFTAAVAEHKGKLCLTSFEDAE
jgi:hypothetical protein